MNLCQQCLTPPCHSTCGGTAWSPVAFPCHLLPVAATCCLCICLSQARLGRNKIVMLVQLQSRGLRSRSNRATAYADATVAGPSVQHSPTPPSRRHPAISKGMNQEVLLQAQLCQTVLCIKYKVCKLALPSSHKLPLLPALMPNQAPVCSVLDKSRELAKGSTCLVSDARMCCCQRLPDRTHCEHSLIAVPPSSSTC